MRLVQMSGASMVAVFAVVSSCLADDLQAVKKHFDDAMSAITSETADKTTVLENQYLAALSNLMERVKNEGNLDAVKAVMRERDRFGADKKVSEEVIKDSFPGLQKVQLAFIDRARLTEQERTLAVRGLMVKYDAELASLQASLTKQGKIDDATQVQEERKKTVEPFLSSLSSQAPQTPVSSTPPDKTKVPLKDITPTLRKKITIPANSDGISIGKLAATQTLTLQYVSGTWGDGGALNGLSPDDLNTQGGCRLRLVGPDTSIVVPYRTKKSPFTFKVLVPGEYFLRTNDGSPGDNPGKVVYRVSTSNE